MNNSKKSNMVEKFALILIVFYIFFGYIIKKEVVQLIFTAIFCIIAIFSAKKYKIKIFTNDIIWLIIGVLLTISLIYSIDKESSIRYNICLYLILILKIALNNFQCRKKEIINCIIFFSSIHVIATIAYLVFPNIIQSICRIILTPEMYEYNVNLMKYGANAGICSEHGFNAFCITVFTNIFFVKTIYKNENKRRNAILTIIGIITLLTTGKRGLFLANVFSMMIIFIIVNFMNKKILKRFFLALIAVLVILKIVSYIPAAQIVFERFKELDSTGNFLNGREVFYEKMFENIKSNPIIGSGVSTTQKITGGSDGHNIYLQILSELGIVGLLIYFVLFIHCLNITIKNLKKKNNLENTLIALYYQIFFLVYGISGNPLYNFSILLIYMIMVNLVINYKKTYEDMEE